MKKLLSLVLALTMTLTLFGMLAPGGALATDAPADTITALLPPVSGHFQENFELMAKEFNELYPNLTLKIEPASWEDMTQKLDTQVNAGSPPDIAFLPSDALAKYEDLGVLVDIQNIATPEMLADYNEAPLSYMRRASGLYGLPAYMEIHALGGNKQFLEDAGIDWQSIQQNGWTYETFREDIKKGVVMDGDAYARYGFIFACAGVTARDYLGILVKNAGMPAAFDADLKYTYTSENFLNVLKAVREMIDDGSMPKELSGVDAGKRWSMFLAGQTMITGKGLATFENSAKVNNAKLEANDGTAAADSIPVEYVVLPVPTFNGASEANHAAVDGYVVMRGKDEPTPEHLANVVKAAYFLGSGKWAAETSNELFVAHVTESARAVAAPTDQEEYNKNAVLRLIENAAPARPDIPAELGAAGIRIEDEVTIPKLQALLAGETTPEEMHEAIKEAAYAAFGEENCLK